MTTPTSPHFELMETTFTLARYFGVTPFDLFGQDTDEVIMVINHYIDKGNDKPKAAEKKSDRVKVNDKTATGGWF